MASQTNAAQAPQHSHIGGCGKIDTLSGNPELIHFASLVLAADLQLPRDWPPVPLVPTAGQVCSSLEMLKLHLHQQHFALTLRDSPI